MEMGTELGQAVKYLNHGELVAIPTETVYGLAANALDPAAVVKIYEAKGRPTFNPLIIHTYSFEQVARYVQAIPPQAQALARAFWPGPLTLLLPRNEIIPDIVTAGNPRVAVRIPAHPLSLELLKQVNFPLAAPSANPSGYISPTTATHVAAQLGKKVAYILDGGPTRVGIESSIVGFEAGESIVYRLGGISMEELTRVIGPVRLLNHSENPTASGMLKSHYAPRVPLLWGEVETLLTRYDASECAVLSFQKTYPTVPFEQQIQLSPCGNLGQAAQTLFAALRELDQMPVKRILAERMPNQGLGLAINDRLQRASAETD